MLNRVGNDEPITAGAVKSNILENFNSKVQLAQGIGRGHTNVNDFICPVYCINNEEYFHYPPKSTQTPKNDIAHSYFTRCTI